MVPPNISLEDFHDAIINKNGWINMPNEYVLNNMLKKNNTLSSFEIDPNAKIFEKMNNFVKNITPVARVDQYWDEYLRISHDMICDQMTKSNRKIHMCQRKTLI